MKYKKFSVQSRLKSFLFAFNGLNILFRNEHNAWIHLLAACCAITAGIVFHISSYEWFAIVIAIGLVLAFELINTAIEKLADFVCPEKREEIKIIKDLAAAGVLVGAIAALVVGLIIFIPKII